MAQILYLATFYNISPYLYSRFRFFEKTNINKAIFYLQNNDMEVLVDALRLTEYKNTNANFINKKDLFLKHCKTYGLPVPPVVVIFYENGQEEWVECQLNNLPPCDLFLKFTNSCGGIGSECWVYDDATKVWRSDLQSLDQIQFISYCRIKAHKNSIMLQRRLVNNREILQFSNGALSTFRVVTYLTPDGKASLLSAGLKMSVGNMIVDNFSAGGIIAGVDLKTGTLNAATGKSTPKLIYFHPDTHAKIVGHKVTNWQEVVDLSIKAQECFRERWSIGWDIAGHKMG